MTIHRQDGTEYDELQEFLVHPNVVRVVFEKKRHSVKNNKMKPKQFPQ
jgi:hypothetical protein